MYNMIKAHEHTRDDNMSDQYIVQNDKSCNSHKPTPFAIVG